MKRQTKDRSSLTLSRRGLQEVANPAVVTESKLQASAIREVDCLSAYLVFHSSIAFFTPHRAAAVA